MKIIFYAIIEVLFFLELALSQVTVAPVTVHLNDADRNGYIVVRNNSGIMPWEVSIDLKFGYPKSDSSGNTFIYFPENQTDSAYSLVNCVSFYPRKFVLQPFEEQTVRISVKPKYFNDGEYWGRPVITSKALNINDTTGRNNISVGVGTQFRTVIALNYRKGKVSTGIHVENLYAEVYENRVVVFADLAREGNSAFLGNAIVTILNDRNEIVKEAKQEISVYFLLHKRFELMTGKLAPGLYSAQIVLNTEREEPGGKFLKSKNVKVRTNFYVKK